MRKQAREHGTGSAIEGHAILGANVLLVEDLITDGGSKLVFVDGLRKAGMQVQHCLVVLDREQGGAGRIRKSRCFATRLDYRKEGT